jgi:hypothetical protein
MRFTLALVFKDGMTPKGLDFWNMINSGPAIIRPTEVNTFEPLRKIQDVNIEVVCQNDFIWQNEELCLGMFNPNGWKGRSRLTILLEYPQAQHASLKLEVYQFIKSNLHYRLLYGVSPTEELMESNLEVHQLANCGAIPPNEEIIRTNRKLYEIFEEHA